MRPVSLDSLNLRRPKALEHAVVGNTSRHTGDGWGWTSEQALKFSNGEHTRYAFNFAGPTHGLSKL